MVPYFFRLLLPLIKIILILILSSKFCLNIRKYFFTMQVTKLWHGLPREVVESLSLEICESYLCMVLGNLP